MYIITIYISNLGDQLRLLLSSSSGIIKGIWGKKSGRFSNQMRGSSG